MSDKRINLDQVYKGFLRGELISRLNVGRSLGYCLLMAFLVGEVRCRGKRRLWSGDLEKMRRGYLPLWGKGPADERCSSGMQ